jgi:short-subunit dehydrogenase
MSLRLAEAGLNVFLVGRNKAQLEELASEVRIGHAVEARVLNIDLSVDASIQTIESATAQLDVGMLVAAAGFGTSGEFVASSLADEVEMLNVNCRAVLLLSRLFAQRFAERGNGGLVLLSSIVGFQGMPYAAHYAATKAYVQALAEALHVELAPLGVDVLASAPGPTDSGFASRAGMKMGLALKPIDVVQPTLEALGRRATVLPGFLSKLLTYSLVPLPRWARVQIMGKIMSNMTKHKRLAG